MDAEQDRLEYGEFLIEQRRADVEMQTGQKKSQ